MPSYENMMITVTLLLFFINGIFLFVTDLPGYEGNPATVGKINAGFTGKDIVDMRNKISGVLNDQNVFVPSSTEDIVDISASSAQKNYLQLFQRWLFSSLDFVTLGLSSKILSGFSLVGTIISLFGAMFFGYFFWIDFFLPPSLTTGIWALNGMIKIFFFVIQLLGLYDIILRVFYAGTGARN
jgi:hypothetical protein